MATIDNPATLVCLTEVTVCVILLQPILLLVRNRMCILGLPVPVDPRPNLSKLGRTLLPPTNNPLVLLTSIISGLPRLIGVIVLAPGRPTGTVPASSGVAMTNIISSISTMLISGAIPTLSSILLSLRAENVTLGCSSYPSCVIPGYDPA